MVEIEFSLLARACLKGRYPHEEALQGNISVCEAESNAVAATVNWWFTTKDARANSTTSTPANPALAGH